jgi:hypothetical protein
MYQASVSKISKGELLHRLTSRELWTAESYAVILQQFGEVESLEIIKGCHEW